MNRFLRTGLVALPLLMCAFPGLMGCGPGQKDRSVVKGKVTIGGQALTAGSVTFTTNDNRQGSAPIGQDGMYEMGDAPQGDVTITVSVPEQSAKDNMMGMDMGAGKEMPKPPPGLEGKMTMPTMPGKIVPIPAKYAKVETSGLTYKVARGEQTKNIELTP